MQACVAGEAASELAPCACGGAGSARDAELFTLKKRLAAAEKERSDAAQRSGTELRVLQMSLAAATREAKEAQKAAAAQVRVGARGRARPLARKSRPALRPQQPHAHTCSAATAPLHLHAAPCAHVLPSPHAWCRPSLRPQQAEVAADEAVSAARAENRSLADENARLRQMLAASAAGHSVAAATAAAAHAASQPGSGRGSPRAVSRRASLNGLVPPGAASASAAGFGLSSILSGPGIEFNLRSLATGSGPGSGHDSAASSPAAGPHAPASPTGSQAGGLRSSSVTSASPLGRGASAGLPPPLGSLPPTPGSINMSGLGREIPPPPPGPLPSVPSASALVLPSLASGKMGKGPRGSQNGGGSPGKGPRISQNGMGASPGRGPRVSQNGGGAAPAKGAGVRASPGRGAPPARNVSPGRNASPARGKPGLAGNSFAKKGR